MLDTIAPNEPPTIVRSADRRRRRGVRPHTTDSGHGPQIGRIPSGWLASSRLFPDATADDYLARHSEFLGPVKLRRGPQGILRQVEVFLPPQSVTGQLCTVDPEQAEEAGRLRDEIQTMAEALLDGQLKLDAWNPPDLTTLLAGWLAEQGCDAIADKEGNLRLTIRGEGCDGQVRIECGADRLRLVMPLGQWTQLSPTAAMAIRLLAAEANDRTRLMRVVSTAHQQAGLHVEAQVDLTGLPSGNPLNRATEALWREMTHMATDSLELALRLLGLELPALADPQGSDLAEQIVRQQESFDRDH
jgi:hypothetical protein